jgi:uncharacterized protein YbaP (TraB family)
VLLGMLLLAVLLTLAPQSRAQDNDRRGFLWEIRKGNQVGLLFGTIHVGRPEFYPLPKSRLAHLQRANVIVLEADISDTARAIAATQKYAMYAEGTPGLDTRLPTELKARIDALLARNQLEAAPLMRLKPWMLANVLALFEAAQAGYMPALAVEAYLARLAAADSKQVLELEGIEQQFELFETAPWATQLAFLEEAVKAVETRAARREVNASCRPGRRRTGRHWNAVRRDAGADDSRGALHRRQDPARSTSSDGASDRIDARRRPSPPVRSRFAPPDRPAGAGRDAARARLHRDRARLPSAGSSSVAASGCSPIAPLTERPPLARHRRCALRKAAASVPAAYRFRRNDEETPARLSRLIERPRPAAIVFLGDLFHAKRPRLRLWPRCKRGARSTRH